MLEVCFFMLRKRKRLIDGEDDDPMGSLTNLSDAMLVLALGFLVFAILALSANPDLLSQAQSQDMQQGQEVSSSQVLNDTSSINASSADSGLSEVGKVYRDPDTGKLVMVSS